jgi:ribosomal protein L40E
MSVFFGIILFLSTLIYLVYPFLKRKPGHSDIISESKTVSEPNNSTQDEIEIQILKLRRKKGNICSKCGVINQEDARYCRQCAASLNKRQKNA